MLITGGVHGDEFEPIVAIRRLGEALSGVDLRGRLTLIPVVNEGAYRLGRRTAEDGLDLARTCPGRAVGTITERVAAALAGWIRSADAYLDLHTGGRNLTLYPLCGYMLHRDPGVLERQRRMARVFGVPVIWGTDPALEGRSLSVARDAGVPAIYAEFGGGGGCDPEGVAAYLRGCRNVLVALGMIEGEVVRPVESLIIEEDRPGSGYLQVQHPSPREGIFESSVSLGQRVRRGERIGWVVDPWGTAAVAVVAERSGIVLGLRAFARVAAGEGLAVVLEMEGELPALSGKTRGTGRSPGGP